MIYVLYTCTHEALYSGIIEKNYTRPGLKLMHLYT